jgi:hypothetical protein
MKPPINPGATALKKFRRETEGTERLRSHLRHCFRLRLAKERSDFRNMKVR